jgi:hypothetical protein
LVAAGSGEPTMRTMKAVFDERVFMLTGCGNKPRKEAGNH